MLPSDLWPDLAPTPPPPPLEVPFENGKVVGLWYVGNTVYTVRNHNYTFRDVWKQNWEVAFVIPVCSGDCQYQASSRVSILDMGERVKVLCSIPILESPNHIHPFPDPPCDRVGEHPWVVLVCRGLFSLLAEISHCCWDGRAGRQPLQVVYVLLSLHSCSVCGNSARLSQNSVSRPVPLERQCTRCT